MFHKKKIDVEEYSIVINYHISRRKDIGKILELINNAENEEFDYDSILTLYEGDDGRCYIASEEYGQIMRYDEEKEKFDMIYLIGDCKGTLEELVERHDEDTWHNDDSIELRRLCTEHNIDFFYLE